MNRLTSQPYEYASIDDLRRGLLVQIRRFNRACVELGAEPTTISLNPSGGGMKKPVNPIASSQFDRLELLRNQISLLKNMAGVLQSKFATDPKSKELLAQVKDFTADIAERANQHQGALHKDAHGKINRSVSIAATKLIEQLKEDYKLKPDQVKAQYLIGAIVPLGGSVANVSAEVCYIRVLKLKDQDGYWHDAYYIMLGFPDKFLASTSPEDKIGAPIFDRNRSNPKGALPKIYVATSDKFKIPAKIRWDTSVNKPTDARAVVRDLLTHNGIIGSSAKRELPVPKESINLAHDNIKTTTVRGDMIIVRVKKVSLIDKTAQDLLLQIRGIVSAGNPKNRDLIRVNTNPKTGQINFVFSLPSHLKGREATPKQLALLKNTLNLSDEDLLKIKTALEDHEQD